MQTSEFESLLTDSTLWNQIESLPPPQPLGTNNPHFLFGVSTCTYQDSGAENCPHSQWAAWEKRCLPPDNQSGTSANLFQLYKTPSGRQAIIERLHKLGVNSYRFSLEWSHIEPHCGDFNDTHLQIYIDLCRHLRDEGITPMITLHHFSEPYWFHDLGSFENPDNIEYFLRFAEYVVPALTQPYRGKPLVTHLCTINEPAIEAFSRYIRGAFSPGCFLRISRAGHFLHGALKAHCIAYERLKALAPEVQIGFVHQHLTFIAKSWLFTPITNALTALVNGVVLNFFKKGFFEFWFPFLAHIKDEALKPQADFIALQCYVRPVIGLAGSTSYGEPMTQMPFREDPASLYPAILETYDACRRPIIVTENGISTHDEEQRARFMRRALFTTAKAADKIGRDNLQGYYLWSLCDNSEWDMGRTPQAFGAYALTEQGLASNPKPGVAPYTKATRAWKDARLSDSAA